MSDERRVLFDLFAPEAMIDEKGCPGEHRHRRYAGCYGCSVSEGLDMAMACGNLTVDVEVNVLHPEFGVHGRRFTGTYEGDVGRLALHRMVAWLHGHPDPLDLIKDRYARTVR